MGGAVAGVFGACAGDELWLSIKDDEKAAVTEAVTTMKAKGLDQPGFVLAYTTSGYDHAVLTKELRAQDRRQSVRHDQF